MDETIIIKSAITKNIKPKYERNQGESSNMHWFKFAERKTLPYMGTSILADDDFQFKSRAA